MSSAALEFPGRMSEQEYLVLERSSDARHERIGDAVHAMGGASLSHNRLVGNLFAELRRRLDGGSCEVFSSDLRLRVHETGLFAYPDLLVICGEPELWQDDSVDTVLNPKVLIEVLSPSTEAFDRGEKFLHYRRVPTLDHYLMVRQDRVLVEHYTRQGDLWLLRTLDAPDSAVELEDLGSIELRKVYAGLSLF